MSLCVAICGRYSFLILKANDTETTAETADYEDSDEESDEDSEESSEEDSSEESDESSSSSSSSEILVFFFSGSRNSKSFESFFLLPFLISL